MIPIAKPVIDEEEKSKVLEVLESGILAHGKVVEEFESKFARFSGVQHAIATNSGTSALHTALAALGISPGDEVITTTFSFIASATCILMQGATPVFCDVDAETYNITVDAIKKNITSKTKAIIPVHLYGQTCDMGPILDLAHDHDLFVVEDACQAHGALYNNKPVGSLGQMGAFSFYPTKNMTTGEGGIVTTNNEALAKKAGMFRNHGQSSRYMHEMLGYNYRMTNLSAAIGLAQLEKINTANKKRRANAQLYNKGFEDIVGIHTPAEADYAHHVYHQYTVEIEQEFPLSRDQVIEQLKTKGIGFGVYYHTPLHQQPLFTSLCKGKSFPVAEKKAKQVLSLPVHSAISKQDITTVLEAFKAMSGA